MLQQLQNLASPDDIIHGYQTCQLVESSENRLGRVIDNIPYP